MFSAHFCRAFRQNVPKFEQNATTYLISLRRINNCKFSSPIKHNTLIALIDLQSLY